MSQTKYYLDIGTKLRRTGNKDNPSFVAKIDKKKMNKLGINPDKNIDLVVIQND